jgi:hypothetical protein
MEIGQDLSLDISCHSVDIYISNYVFYNYIPGLYFDYRPDDLLLHRSEQLSP